MFKTSPFVPFDVDPELQQAAIHPFFTSRGDIESPFNCAFGAEEGAGAVTENRTSLAEQLGVSLENLCVPNQHHSATVAVVTDSCAQVAAIQADALVTENPEIIVSVLTADCIPLLLADPKARIIAAVHAGWRGIFSDIAENGLQAMERLGARREEIRAIIGPCIRKEAYLVGEEMRVKFSQKTSENSAFFIPATENKTYHCDLPGLLNAQLIRNGLQESFIHDLQRCTYGSATDFFSHRREAPCGRQLSGIMLSPADPRVQQPSILNNQEIPPCH